MEKVHDRESLARPEPEISSMWSRMMLRKRASAIIVTIVIGLRVAVGTGRPRAGLGQTGELQAPEQTPPTVEAVTPQGAVTARETFEGTGTEVSLQSCQR